ncbi:hypothetical protein IS446_07450 [Robertkochia sp. 1368]|nr:hypothetical protein [Robertkochia sediminum]
MITYFKYLLRSTNEHGVHSPFVYDLVTKALRHKDKMPKHPTAKELPFFDSLPGKYQRALNNSLHHLFGAEAPVIALGSFVNTLTSGASLVFLESQDQLEPTAIAPLLERLGNETVILLNKTSDTPLWRALTQHPEIHLTVDCHRIGMAWKRAQQAKENFTIRL